MYETTNKEWTNGFLKDMLIEEKRITLENALNSITKKYPNKNLDQIWSDLQIKKRKLKHQKKYKNIQHYSRFIGWTASKKEFKKDKIKLEEDVEFLEKKLLRLNNDKTSGRLNTRFLRGYEEVLKKKIDYKQKHLALLNISLECLKEKNRKLALKMEKINSDLKKIEFIEKEERILEIYDNSLL